MIPEAQKQQMAEAVAKIRETMAAAAIAEGATIVRVGTAIYGARDYSKKA